MIELFEIYDLAVTVAVELFMPAMLTMMHAMVVVIIIVLLATVLLPLGRRPLVIVVILFIIIAIPQNFHQVGSMAKATTPTAIATSATAIAML